MSKAEETKSNVGSKRGFGDLGVLLALSLLAATFRGCNFSQPETTPASKLVNTSEITYNTDQFMYRTVTIRSKALDKIGPSSFTVKDKQLFDSEPIVVVNASGVPFNLPADTDIEVLVTGSVRRLDIPTIEQEYNLNLQDEYYKKYINKPAVIAQEIKLAPQENQITQTLRK
ncbi:MAG: hypothetical protein ICV78_09255 [Tolypothrix sp. Co-bin9]|nr:hypothetical protein [Tolypothrix sp. Co-bin9]